MNGSKKSAQNTEIYERVVNMKKCLMCKSKTETGAIVSPQGDVMCMDCYLKFLNMKKLAKIMYKFNPRWK